MPDDTSTNDDQKEENKPATNRSTNSYEGNKGGRSNIKSDEPIRVENDGAEEP